MEDDQAAVGGLVHVQLDPVRGLLDRKTERGHRIFGRVAGGPTVGDDQRMMCHMGLV
jgi:hypothetical protein